MKTRTTRERNSKPPSPPKPQPPPRPSNGGATELVSSRKESEKWVTRFIKERKVKDICTFDNKTFWNGYSGFYEDAVCFGINKVEVTKNPADPSSRRR